MNEENLNITTELNGEVIQLTEEEVIFLLEYRMMNEEEQEKIQELIGQIKSEEHL